MVPICAYRLQRRERRPQDTAAALEHDLERWARSRAAPITRCPCRCCPPLSRGCVALLQSDGPPAGEVQRLLAFAPRLAEVEGLLVEPLDHGVVATQVLDEKPRAVYIAPTNPAPLQEHVPRNLPTQSRLAQAYTEVFSPLPQPSGSNLWNVHRNSVPSCCY